MNHAIVSREEWLIAREALFAKERAMTHDLDALRAERQQLPWVRVQEAYVFDRWRMHAGRPFRDAQPTRHIPFHADARIGPSVHRLRVHG